MELITSTTPPVVILNAVEIRKLKYQELQEYATKIGVDSKHLSEKKPWLLDRTLQKSTILLGSTMKGDVEIVPDMQAYINDAASGAISKAHAFRSLHDLGMLSAQIARECNAHYSFVHATIERYKVSKGNLGMLYDAIDSAAN